MLIYKKGKELNKLNMQAVEAANASDNSIKTACELKENEEQLSM